MARHFKEQDIDEFRDCFYLKTGASGQITTTNELKNLMRSLGLSPTLSELQTYFKEKGEKISFADFLDIMYSHSKKENLPDEILAAFHAWDRNKTGQISCKDLKHILCHWGEKLETRQIEQIFREANITGQYLKYQDFIRIISAPLPDY